MRALGSQKPQVDTGKETNNACLSSEGAEPGDLPACVGEAPASVSLESLGRQGVREVQQMQAWEVCNGRRQ